MSRRATGRVRVRRWAVADIGAIVECQRAAYPDYPLTAQYDERIFELQHAAFPEGQYLAELNGEVVGYATSMIVQLEDSPHTYDYDEVTGAGTFSTHSPGGDTLYGADIAVHPSHRGRGIAGRLYEARKRIVRRYNLRRMLAYGRLPGFPEYAGKLTAQEYVEKVVAGELSDQALSAHLKAGYRVAAVTLGIMRDASSLDWATLIEYENPHFNRQRRRIAASPLRRPVRKLRVCAAQYLMRAMSRWEEFERSVRFFAEVTEEYHGHFLVLPELFPAVMLPLAPRSDDARDAFEFIAEQTPRVNDLLAGLARDHGLYIVGGSAPLHRDGALYNVSHLFTPSGARHAQDKLHITPGERKLWGVRPGERLRVFDTPFARVAILICYDIEFPELARLLAMAGVEVIFVPFSTDDRKAYQRVRITAHARAVENSLYVVLAGNAGNLPARNYMLNYARSAVLTPSDVGFPDSAVVGEAEPNVETVVLADLDFTAISQLRADGSVRPFEDLRPDLYELRSKLPLEIIPVE